MKFLVLGCNGMAGHLISLYLKEQGHDVTGFARKDIGLIKTIVGDARDKEKLTEVIKSGKYDSVINCIGILNQFAERDHATAVYMNAYLPHFLAAITEGTETQVIHMSTDCVFSGSRGGYTEYDVKDGTTFYDQSKALGELDDDKNLTLRNSIVGPDINPDGIGLLNWFMKSTVESGSQVSGYTKTMWTGQTTLQLAKTMEAAAKEKAHGLYNMVPDKSISKADLLKLFNKYLRKDTVDIMLVDGVIADKSLKRTNYDFGYIIPDYEVMVKELSDWTVKHKDLYPHYEL